MERDIMFAVQSYYRSGTHMLKSALNQHHDIQCFGEVFNSDCPDFVRSAEEILQRMRKSKIQIGFVEHAVRKDLWLDIKKAKKNEKIIIINLFRRNLFERYISQQIAKKTTQWGTGDPGYILRTDPWEGNPRDAQRDFEKVLSTREKARKRFPQAPWFAYEDLVKNTREILRRIQRRLGVTTKNLKPTTIKQGKPLRNEIKNYGEVKRFFSGTKYERHFDG